MGAKNLTIRGAREHNLRNITLDIPRDKFVVITGLSGSGKSSLAFDTIYAEGQRRYVESLSAYARQFLGLMEKPDVDVIEGLSPAVSIEQKSTSKNPRSTVGTVTEIYDYLRLLYARIGIPHCPECGKEISMQTKDQITDQILEKDTKGKVYILAPIVRDRKGEYHTLFADLIHDGYTKAYIDGELSELDGGRRLPKYEKHSISIVVDHVKPSKKNRQRILEAVEASLNLAQGLVKVRSNDEEAATTYSQAMGCPTCNVNIPELQPRMFSFNSPHGACPACEGLGTRLEFDPDLIIPDKLKSINDGAVAAWGGGIDTYYMSMAQHVAQHFGFSLDDPVSEMKTEDLDKILYGAGKERIHFKHVHNDGVGRWEHYSTYEGIIPNLKRRHKETKSEGLRDRIQRFMSSSPCDTCGARRLRPEALGVTVGNLNISKLCEQSIGSVYKFFLEVSLTEKEAFIARQVLKEIKERLRFLENVGLSYLTLERSAGSLSGGEAQRIRLATQIGSQLVGVLYILDEPSIGLHQRDNKRLLSTLKQLRDLGNTVIVVEHDMETMLEADHIVDLGPGAGVHGGGLVATGTPKEIMACEKSLTGQYLTGNLSIEIPKIRREGNGVSITVTGARCHNLRNLDVKFPLGKFVCVTGVSGSGKSSLVNEILAKAIMRRFYRSGRKPGEHDSILGTGLIDKAVVIDQSPIGRTPRSNPATYTGLFTPIRELYSEVHESKVRGYKPGRFSFNVPGGRCDTCEGDGVIKIEMNFLPDVYVKCDQCKGKRYNEATLEITYKGRNISDVLRMTVDEALKFFENIPSIKNKLQTLSDVGLGYMKLGQSATTLSGGEAQRVKISLELSKRSTGKTLYLLDEPTTGLHFHDIKKLLSVLERLVESGNTVIVIEHNLDVIKCADHIIDLGPEGGDDGGKIIAEGTPEEVASIKSSYTGQFLQKILPT